MIELQPKSLFSNSFQFPTADGSFIDVEVSPWRERAHFELDGIKYSLYRESVWKSVFVLEREQKIFARAKKRSIMSNSFDVDLAGKPLTLEKKSIFGRHFFVLEGEKQVGEIYRKGLWAPRTYVDLPGDWPVPLQLYLFWLALVIWTREEAAWRN